MRCFGSDLSVKVFCGEVVHTICRRCYTAAGQVCPLCKYMFGGICETNPPSNAFFLGTTLPSKAKETPKKSKTQATQIATREAKVEGTPKKEKKFKHRLKFKYDRMKGYSVKTLLEDGYKVVVWDATKAYNPAVEEYCVALDYLATTYTHLQDIQSNPCTEDMPWDSAPAPADEKGVCRLCKRRHESYSAAHCQLLLPVAGVDNCHELFCNTCLFPVEL